MSFKPGKALPQQRLKQPAMPAFSYLLLPLPEPEDLPPEVPGEWPPVPPGELPPELCPDLA